MPSSSSPLPFLILRIAQALLALIVFALSTSLIQGRVFGSIPLTLVFSILCGGLSFVGAILGVAAQWWDWELLTGKLGLVLDGVFAGFHVVTGVFMAVKLKGVRCQHVSWLGDSTDLYDLDKNVSKMLSNSIICGGLKKSGDEPNCGYLAYDDGVRAKLFSRCVMSQADAVFLFLTAGVVGVAAVTGYMRLKRSH